MSILKKTIFGLGLIAVCANGQDTVKKIVIPAGPTTTTTTSTEESSEQTEQPEEKEMWLKRVIHANLTLSTNATLVGAAKAARNDKLNLQYAKKQVFISWLGKRGQEACSDSAQRNLLMTKMIAAMQAQATSAVVIPARHQRRCKKWSKKWKAHKKKHIRRKSRKNRRKGARKNRRRNKRKNNRRNKRRNNKRRGRKIKRKAKKTIKKVIKHVKNNEDFKKYSNDPDVRAAVKSIVDNVKSGNIQKAVQEVQSHLKNDNVMAAIKQAVDNLSDKEKSFGIKILKQAIALAQKLRGRKLTANGRILCASGMDCAHGAGRPDAPAEDQCSVHLARLFRLINQNLNHKWHRQNKRWERRQERKANATTSAN